MTTESVPTVHVWTLRYRVESLLSLQAIDVEQLDKALEELSVQLAKNPQPIGHILYHWTQELSEEQGYPGGVITDITVEIPGEESNPEALRTFRYCLDIYLFAKFGIPPFHPLVDVR